MLQTDKKAYRQKNKHEKILYAPDLKKLFSPYFDKDAWMWDLQYLV